MIHPIEAGPATEAGPDLSEDHLSGLTDLPPAEALRLLRLAVAQTSDAVIITDAQIQKPGPHILYANPAFLAMTRYAAGEVLGRTPRLLQGPETDPALLARIRHCLTAGVPFHGEGVNYRKGQEPYQAEWSITPLRAGGAGVTHFMASLRDVTDRKRFERQIGDQLQRIHGYSRALEAQKQTLESQKEALEEANGRLRALATTDGLTGLHNHREFHERLDREVCRAARECSPLSLVLLDVDCFKSYNDSFGHPAGDEVLKTAAGLLRRHARHIDLVARYGGEEFAVLLPGADADCGGRVAERLRRSFAEHGWPSRPVTASLGVATAAPGTAGRRLVDEADKALYRAKAAGRNRVTHFGLSA